MLETIASNISTTTDFYSTHALNIFLADLNEPLGSTIIAIKRF